jgi:hypothetical protein
MGESERGPLPISQGKGPAHNVDFARRTASSIFQNSPLGRRAPSSGDPLNQETAIPSFPCSGGGFLSYRWLHLRTGVD